MSEMSTLVGQGIATAAAMADRLGLTWQLRPATVASSTEASSTVSVLLDGDTAPIDAVSLLGGWLQVGARVMVAAVPPAANFIVGYAMSGHVADRLTYDAINVASSPLTLAAMATLVPGTTHTVSVTGAARYMATGIFDFDETVLGTGVAVGELYVDGSVEPVGSQALLEVKTVTDRATVTQQWSGTLAAGAHTLESYGRRTGAAGTIVANALHTTLRVQVYE